jgi:hypothetical protein
MRTQAKIWNSLLSLEEFSGQSEVLSGQRGREDTTGVLGSSDSTKSGGKPVSLVETQAAGKQDQQDIRKRRYKTYS